MARRACAELDWFPTPRQCLALIDQYRPPISEKDIALSLCHQFFQGRFEDFISDLKLGLATQDLVDAVPLKWRQIAMEQGYLRWISEQNQYAIRRKVLSA